MQTEIMRTSKWMNPGCLLLAALLNGCGVKENEAAMQSGPVEPFSQAPNEQVIRNKGIYYTVRYHNEKDASDTLSRYLFVIEQSTDQGKNVLEYQVADYALYAKRLNYYNVEMNNDIMLIACGDTLQPVQTLYENNLGIIPENKIVTVFKKTKANCELQLVFNDRPFENYLNKANFNDK